MAFWKNLWDRFKTFIKELFLLEESKKSKKVKRKKHIVLKKYEGNPIIKPNPKNEWEAWQTFNPGAVLINDKVHLLYRAVGRGGVSRFGYAFSKDGFKINKRLPYPVYQHLTSDENYSYYSCASGGSWSGCEDPRITRVKGENRVYVTYTACHDGLRVALTSINIEDLLNEKWEWSKPKLLSPPGEVHKNWVLFPEKINGKYAILHSIYPEILIDYFTDLKFENDEFIESSYEREANGKERWDSLMRGAGPPPLKTKDGWLLFYHAMSKDEMNKYKVGVMLLDLEDPSRVIHRSPEPVLKPEEYYEWNGFKGGVVYASGAVIKNGELIVYFGGADSYVCVTHADLNTFLTELKKDNKPRLEHNLLKKQKNS